MYFCPIFCFRFSNRRGPPLPPPAAQNCEHPPPPLTSPAVNTPRCIRLQGEGTWRFAKFWWKSKRMWPRKLAGMTPYHPLRSFLFLHFLPIFCFRFFEPSCSASAPARGSKLRTSPPPPLHVPCSQCTPLHKAAEGGHLETCKFLVQVKADVAAEDRFDTLLLARACV